MPIPEPDPYPNPNPKFFPIPEPDPSRSWKHLPAKVAIFWVWPEMLHNIWGKESNFWGQTQLAGRRWWKRNTSFEGFWQKLFARVLTICIWNALFAKTINPIDLLQPAVKTRSIGWHIIIHIGEVARWGEKAEKQGPAPWKLMLWPLPNYFLPCRIYNSKYCS